MQKKSVKLAGYSVDYLEKEMQISNKSASKTIENIFKEHEQFKQLIIDRNSLVEQIYDRFKKDISTILARTGHTVKNSNVAMELWNGFLFANNQSEYVTTDEFVSTPFKKATEKVNNEIAGLRQKKLEKK
ncbi:hypothetical protein D4A35_17880 (plasmid) [Paraclostridium bifermentans]|uniref:Uncharacterized protein n=1 Tax=Paraclostridium bifermentans TaxID=1490 RepID=A0A5P3XKA4_PARBF|nr:hypothetical protein [Paraclostridium bifermentans]QEZ70808.1 hypothetical protein D4A35_17880 [Paraclostridium bifermentans]